jgi:uncharacterized repeat protein (TIGR01451 family)
MESLSLRATLLLSLSLVAPVGLYGQLTAVPPESRAAAVRSYLELPLAFEKQDQAKQDQYVARGQSYSIGLSGARATIAGAPVKGSQVKAISLAFTGARSPGAVPGPQLPGKVNYIHGNDPRQWQLNRSTFGRITYPEIYRGIDVVYYGNQQQLEFDLVLKPGADPNVIRLKVEGGEKLAIDGSGALKIGDGNLQIGLPKIYQEVNGAKKSVSGRYVLRGRNEIAFNIEAYDRTRPLVIDPTIVYSAVLGGSNAAIAFSVALDSSGDAYIAGWTNAGDFPTVNAFQSGLNSGQDGFVAEMNSSGTALLYSTYIGGSSTDELLSIAVDSNQNAWVAGYSFSPDFPVKNATQSTYGGAGDAVMVELNSTGALQFSTYLGGSAEEQAYGVAVDGANNAYITGYTAGAFPTTTGVLQSANQGSNDVFVAEFSPSDAEVYATLLGGTGSDIGYAIAADASGAYVAGGTNSTAFNAAPAGGAQAANGGVNDAFVAKLNPTGTAIMYFTFLGGSRTDQANAIAVDAAKNVYVAGVTASPNLTTTGTLQFPFAGGRDGFVAELNAAGTAFTWLTYLGGNRTDYLQGLSLDGLGNIYVAGYSNSTNLPVAAALQPVPAGSTVSLFQTSNSGASWSAFDMNIPGAVGDLSADPAHSGNIVVVTEQGIFLTTNAGSSWSQQLSVNDTGTGSIGAFLARSPAATSTIYATIASAIYQSTDNGVTWKSMAVTSFSPAGIVADPLTAGTAYVFASGSGIYKTTNNGGSFSSVSGTGSGLPNQAVASLTAGPDGTLYAAMTGNGVYMSTNQGSAWSAFGEATGLGSAYVPALHSIAVSPSAPATAYAAAEGSLFETTDGGSSFTQLPFPDAAAQVAISPANSSFVYVVTPNAIVYESPDGGSTWNLAATGLNSTSGITQIEFDPTAASHVFALSFTTYSAFIAKLNPTASSPSWLTYLGGPGNNALAFGVAADGKGNAFVAGYRNGPQFPATSPASSAPTSAANAFLSSAFLAEISDATAACSYAVSPSTAVLTGNPQTTSAELLAPSGCAWTAKSDSTWAMVTTPSGAGTGSAYVQIAPNTTGSSRTATITIGGQTFSISQADSSCTYVLTPSNFNAPAAGGSFSSVVTAAPGCPWAVAGNYGPAIAITSATSGSGGGTIRFNVAPNTGLNTRTLTIPVENTQITVFQAGICAFSLSAPGATFGPSGTGGGTVSVNVTASAAGCLWSASSNVNGFSIVTGTSGTGNGTVTYSVAANTGGDPRAGNLSIAGLPFRVSQAGAGQVYLMSTIAGGQQPTPAITATTTSIPFPAGVVVDPEGNAYITSQTASAVFRLSPGGVLTRVAGTGFNGYSGDGGLAVNAQLSSPTGMALDSAGNLYIADSNNNRIRMVTPTGTISTIAGTGSYGFAGDGGPATSAQFEAPNGVAVDSLGNIYIADSNNNRVRAIIGGTINTIAGNGTFGYSGDGAAATNAQLASPQGVAVNGPVLYIADTSNNRIRKVVGGIISTVAGNGNCCFAGDGGPATGAQLNFPRSVALDGAGNLYIADTNDNRVRIVAENGIITTLAGNGNYNFAGDGGAATSAALRSPFAVAIDGSGNVWIAEYNNQRVREVSAGIINTIAGGGGLGEPGPAPLAALSEPSSVLKGNGSGNVYFTDQLTNRIRQIAPDGSISTIAGTGVAGYSGDGGPAASAMISDPQALIFDPAGNMVFIDANNYRVRKIDKSTGNITTIAGNGTCCYSGDGGPATSAQINFGTALAFDGTGNLYIADTNNNRVREVLASNGNITTVAGTGVNGYSGDSGPAVGAKLANPSGVAVDSSNKLYIADTNNQRIRLVSSGTITTFAGNGNCCFSGDGGALTSAQFNQPRGLAFDGAGNLYIVDTSDQRIREITGGTVVTLAGNGGYGNVGDGGAAVNGNMRTPLGLSVDNDLNIYVAEGNNNTIRLLTPVGTTPVLTISSSHAGSFNAGGTGTYTLTVNNALSAAATTGTVTVTEVLPAGLTLGTMSGSGWTCTANSCTSTAAVAGGSSYPAITVSVNVSGTAPLQVTNQVTVAGGGAATTGASDFTLITPNTPAAPVLISPANAATNVSVLPTLTWSASVEATSYDVYFGTSSTPPFLANTTGLGYVPATMSALLAPNTTYYWQVVAKNGAGTGASAVFSFTTYPSSFCTYSLTPAAGASFNGGGGAGSLSVTAPAGCIWTVVSSQSWLAISSEANGSGNGTVSFLAAPNTGASRSATITLGGQTFTVTQNANYLITSLIAPQQPFAAIAGTSTVLSPPTGVAVDSAGNTYIASPNLNQIYKLDPSGTLTVFAGTGICGSAGDGGLATSAQLCYPAGVAVDASGNVYIADSGNERIREVSSAGVIATIAGTGQCCYAGDGGPATSAWLNFPEGVAVDSAGNVYIADTNNQRVRRITGGTITTIAGNGTQGYAGDGAAATSAKLNQPQGVAVDAQRNVYIADRNNNRVREVLASNGNIVTFAGNNVCCNVNDGGPATNAWLASVQGITGDAFGNVYIADTANQRIREVASNGVIATVAGSGPYGFTGDGGSATTAQLRSPQGIAVDALGNLWIADTFNGRVREVTAGKINTVAGLADNGLPVPFTNLGLPQSTVVDSAGNVYIADSANNRVRMISSAGVISTVAGTGVQGYSGDGAAATSAMLNSPQAVALDKSQNLYILDSGNYRVRMVSGGTITTVAGNGNCCNAQGDGGPATSAQISYSYGIAFDKSNNLYIADSNNHRIRMVSGGTITTVAGNGTSGYSGDGAAATSAQLNFPNGVVVDGSGNLYIGDTNNQRIRKVSGGTISTFAGNGNCCFAGDGGPATSAQLNNPRGVILDNVGNLYFADTNDNRIREVTVTGTILTVAGNGGGSFAGDGGSALNADFRNPQTMAFDTAGNLYVADTFNDSIRMLSPAGTLPVLSITSTHTGSFNAGATGSYTLTVSNANLAAPTSGTVTVADALPASLALNSMSGSGWTCTANTCNRTDPLPPGTSYPAITVSVNVSGTAPLQVTNVAGVLRNGGALAAGAEDLTFIIPNAPSAPVLVSPANSATDVSVLPALTWNAATDAVSYDVYFGTSSTPPFLANTTGLSYVPATMSSPLTVNTIYFWQVVARNATGQAASPIFSFTTYPNGFCTYSLASTSASFGPNGGAGSVTVNAPAGCLWTASSSQTWLSITSVPSGSGNGTVNYGAAPNTGVARSATLTAGGQTFTVTEIADYLISSIIGQQQPPTAALGTAVNLPPANGVAVDSAGNTYISAQNVSAIYKLDTSGVLTRYAGTGICGFSGDGGPATQAQICYPNGLAVDSFGVLYIADSGNARIRTVTPKGVIGTVAGGTCCALGDGGPATNASLSYPEGVGVDSAGNIYIADTNNNRIRKVTGGTITTVAGNGTYGFAGDTGAATSAQLAGPMGVVVDSSFNFYIADRGNNRVRKVTSRGTITTYAGDNVCCNLGDGAAATSAWLANPQGVSLDSSGNLYIADSGNGRIRVVSASGTITTIAGNGNYNFGGDGGPATSAWLEGPQSVAVDSAGDVFIADTNNLRVREVIAGTINTIAGGGPIGDGGQVPFAALAQPGGVARDGSGNIYVADTSNNRVRMITPAGVISTVAGTGSPGFSGDGAAATSAMLNHPQAVVLDKSANLYIVDSYNNRIRMVSGGNITTVAGNGNYGFAGDGAAATGAQLANPQALAIDSAGDLFIADANNQRIREVSGGNINTVAGNGTAGFSGDGGTATNAQLANPTGVAVNAAGDTLYIADNNNQRIRVATGGKINTFAGNGNNCCNSLGDGGPATSAELNYPRGVALDGAGTLYIADTNDQRIRVVTSGTIQTIAGFGNFAYAGDGGPALSGIFANPQSLTVDSGGNIYVADNFNNAIRLLTPGGTAPVLTVASTHTGSFIAGAGASYTITVANAASAGPASGMVTVTELPPASLTLTSMSGTGWTCTANSCTRSDGLIGGTAWPAITVAVNVSATAPYQVTNQVTVSGGGAPAGAGEDLTTIAFPGAAISILAPDSAIANSTATPIVVSGTGITSGSTLSWFFNGATISLASSVKSGQLVATIPASLLTATGTAQVGITNASGGASNQLPFTITGSTPQTITFGALSDVAPTVAPFTIAATASSGLTVSFTSTTLSVCTVSGTTVTIVSSGGCSITARQTGNATYAEATPVTQSFTVYFNDVQPLSVDPSDFYYNAVNLFAQYGITAGCGNDDFCLNQNVTRAQMAVFIIRAMFGTANFNYSPTPHFSDVQPTDFGFKWIQAMYELGITAGCGNGNYCPNDPVTRDSMSVFIIAARLGAGVSFNYTTTPYFTDVQPGTDFAFKFVQRMKDEGITGGCTATTFCPGSAVTRGQMAVFMMVGLFNQLRPAGTPVITSISPSTLHPGTSGTFTITGSNTSFNSSTVVTIPGVTVGTITVNSATSLTVQLTAAANAAVQPRSIDAITGTQEAVLPNGLFVQ